MSSEEITITVRGVDRDVWAEFQESIKKRYSDSYGRQGPELTAALKNWLETTNQQQKLDLSKYLVDPKVPRVLSPNGGMSIKSLIFEVMKSLGGEATIQEVTEYVHREYGPVNPNTISTAMSDLAVNGPPSSLYRMEARFLQRVSRGRYRLIGERGGES